MIIPKPDIKFPIKRIRFRTSSDAPAISSNESTISMDCPISSTSSTSSSPTRNPPPAYDDPAHSVPPSTPHSVSESFAPRRNAMDEDDRPSLRNVAMEEVDPNIVRMFLEDYRRTRIYVREMEWREARRKLLQRHLYKWYALAIIVITLSALLSVKHDTIVEFTEPLTHKIRSWPCGWLVPIVLLIIVSFPPLIGHEIIGILCGLVWGFGVGFAILAAGTFFGEMATWIAFKWFCTTRAQKFERKNRLYWSLTQLIREKSFTFVLILRFSAVPGHIVTAVSASAGANVWSYMAAAILTLPKQLTIAYLGQAFGSENEKNTIISASTTVLTLIMTVIAAVYIYYQMRLLMRRRNREEAMALPTTVSDLNNLRLDMSEINSLNRRRTVHGSGRLGEYRVDEKSDLWTAALTGGEATEGSKMADLQDRKPWLFANTSLITTDDQENGTGGPHRAPQRSRSLPGPMTADAMKSWQAEIEDIRGLPPTQGPAIVLNDDDEDLLQPGRSRGLPSYLSMTPSSPRSHTKQVDAVAGPSLSPFLDQECDNEPCSSSGSRQHKRSDSETKKAGGREIAEDADLYALSHGGSRPGYGRSRGSSSAALLSSRPGDVTPNSELSDDDRSSYEKDRIEERLEEDTITPLGNGKGKQREYGRSRGESGAALLGRPELNEDDESVKSV